ncbi:MAG: hypothetical protein ACRCUA_02280 [Fusobacteriaceae bacterium]
MEKRKKNRMKYFYLVLMLCFFYTQLEVVPVLGYNVSGNMEKYFGISKYLIYLIILMNYFVEYVENRKEKNCLIIINYYTYLVFLSASFLFLVYKLNILNDFSQPYLERNFLNLSIFKYNLGLIPTYFMEFLIFFKDVRIFYSFIVAAVLILIVMAIIILNWGVLRVYKNLTKGYRTRKELERKEREIAEKIAIKESIERNELEQKKRIAEEREKQIQEMVKLMNQGEDE